MNSCEFVHFISSLACVIAQSTTDDELAILATFFTQLGDTLATITATKLDTKTASISNINSDICSNKCIDTNTDKSICDNNCNTNVIQNTDKIKRKEN